MKGQGKRTIHQFERQNFRKAALVQVWLDELLSGWELVWVQLVLGLWREGSCCHRHRRHRREDRRRCRCYQWWLRSLECTVQVVH